MRQHRLKLTTRGEKGRGGYRLRKNKRFGGKGGDEPFVVAQEQSIYKGHSEDILKTRRGGGNHSA